jgi:hypothetical protein
MAGQVRPWLAAALALATAVSALAQAPAEPSATPATPLASPPEEGGRLRNWLADHPHEGPRNPAFENVRKALDALTPEQRKRFQENFMRWSNLSPEEKKALREREEVRKKFMEEEVQAAIQESGLQLDADRREQFVKRYSEERRTIEEQLHKEMAEKRRPLVHELVTRLKAEFAAEGAPATSGAPIPPSQTTIQTSSPGTPAKP